jgi:hypothetical protein
VGYRKTSHFQSAQTLELDFDQGDESSAIAHLITDPFIARYASFLYTTLSSTPATPKTRVVFVLDSPITDTDSYRQARLALLNKYRTSDQSIKDVARFLYGSNPKTGEFWYAMSHSTLGRGGPADSGVESQDASPRQGGSGHP